jgi:hypothetical protein
MIKYYTELKALLAHYTEYNHELLQLIFYGLKEFFCFDDLEVELLDYLSTVMEIPAFKEYILNKVSGDC